MNSGILTVLSIVPSAMTDILRVEATLDGKRVVFNAEFIHTHFGEREGWAINFDDAYWDMFKSKGEYWPDPGQLHRLLARVYHGEQITFPVEIGPGW